MNRKSPKRLSTKNFLFFLLILPSILSAQTHPPTKLEQTQGYTRVIEEYIKAIASVDTLKYDTLYIGKHEEFPDVTLPHKISGKTIILHADEKDKTQPHLNRSFKLVNIIEMEVYKEKWNFMLVTFHQGYHPQHNSFFDLKYDHAKKEFELIKKVRYDFCYPARKQ